MTRIRTRAVRLGAGAATGAVVLSLACGPAAFAADTPIDAASGLPAAAASPDPAAGAPAPAAPTLPEEPPAAASTDAAAIEPGQAAPAPTAPAPSETAEPAPTEPAPPAEEPEPDTAPPAVVLELPRPTASGWHTDLVYVSIAAGDAEGPVMSVTYQVDDSAPVSIDKDWATALISGDGHHTIAAWATDAAGNVSETQTRTFKIDKTPPTVNSYSQQPGALVRLGASVELTYGCADALSGIDSCTDDGRPDDLLDTSTVGEHEVTITAVDKAGNQALVPYTYRVVDDRKPPVLSATLNGVRNGSWLISDDASVTVTATDEVTESMLSYRIDNGWFQHAGQASATIPLTDGVHTIDYYAYDLLGNATGIGTVEARRDATAPLIAFAATDSAGAAVENGAVITRGAEISFGHECSDATSGIEDCTSEVEAGSLLDTDELGHHSVLMTAKDVAGHKTSRIFEYTVEDEPVQEPTDPGTDQPGQPSQPAPGQPAPGSPAAIPTRGSTGAEGELASMRAPAAADERLASTGVGLDLPLRLLAGGLAAAGSLLMLLGLRRRDAS